MDDRIRVSDADRDRVTARLRDHFAAGRLTPGELDERISAALSAKTFGDLRRIMADLPEPAPAPSRPAGQWAGPPHHPHWAGPRPWGPRRPRVLPLVLLVLLAGLLLHGGGWVLGALFMPVLLLWFVMCVGGLFFGMSHRRTHYR